MATQQSHRAWRWAAWAGAALVLGIVFASWLRPGMMFAVMTQVWSCL